MSYDVQTGLTSKSGFLVAILGTDSVKTRGEVERVHYDSRDYIEPCAGDSIGDWGL